MISSRVQVADHTMSIIQGSPVKVLESSLHQGTQLNVSQGSILVFIDSAVEEFERLVHGAIPQATVILLDSVQDGIEQITQVLRNCTNVTDVHLVCHASPGCLILGNTQLNLSTLDRYLPQMEIWSTALSAKANLLLYGCEIAAGNIGKAFIQRLHQLTKLHIAASAERVGNSAKGGSWQLKPQIGQITPKLAFLPDVMQGYPGVFPASFTPATNFGIGGAQPSSVAVGDFNGDGFPDLVASNAGQGLLSVLLNDGAGNFGLPTILQVGDGSFFVGVEDFNGDGQLDLITANSFSDNLSVLLNNGAGGFNRTDIAAGDSLRSVAFGDFNGDNLLDLAVTNSTPNNVSVLFGDGIGGFNPGGTFGVGLFPFGIAVADFNGDGLPDLVTSNIDPASLTDNVSVLLNGAGGFGTATNFATGGGQSPSVAVGDFNRDGRPDIVTTNIDANNISVLLNDGQGGFTRDEFATGTGPVSVAVADFDGDGFLDIATSNRYSDNVSVLLGDGAGGFGDATNFPTGDDAIYVAVGDFNRDGLPDLTVANSGSSNVAVLLNTTATIAFSQTTYQVNENGTAVGVAITLRRTGEPIGTASVDVRLTNGTATGGVDFDSTPQTITFAANQTEATFTVPITDDNLVEGNENLTLILGSPSAGIQIGTPNTATLEIIDNDSPPSTVAFSQATYLVNENGTAVGVAITLNRTGDTSGISTVEAQLGNGTATGGVDFDNTPQTITFAANQTEATLTVPITEDDIREGNETLDLTLANPSAGTQIGTQNTASLKIIDNDTAGVTLIESDGSTNVTEGDAPDTYSLVLNSIPTAPVTITLDPDDEVDLGSGAGNPISLTFAADITALTPQTITVAAVDDAIVQGSRTRLITHQIVSNDPNYKDFEIPNLSVNITDNDTPTGGDGTTPVALVKNNNDVFQLEGPTGQVQPLQFTLTKRDVALVNEVGLFVVDDDLGTVDGIAPNQPGYLQAALSRGQVIFSALADNVFPELRSTRQLSFEVGNRLGFYLVQNSTTDAVLAGQTPNIFFAFPSSNIDGFDHLQVSDLGNSAFTLGWEDAIGGGDRDFNDLELKVELTNNPPLLGTQYQGQFQGELIDLTDVVTGLVSAEFEVNSEAAFENTFGFYRVDDATGRIGNLNPGDAGYAQAAISGRVDLSAGVLPNQLLAPFLIADSTPEAFLAQNANNQLGNGPLAYFAFLGANPDRVDHIRLLADNTFGFEDLFGGGDLDYNDLVVQVNF